MGLISGVSGRKGWGKIHRRPNRVSPLGVMLLGLRMASPAVLPAGQTDAAWAASRQAMVADQIAARGVRDRRVLAAMADIPRHLFVPREVAGQAYEDHPLPIGQGQTISQPYIVAIMTECLALKGGDKVLEVGTGSGYQAAVLARIAGRVFTIEIDAALAARAAETLERLGIGNVRVRAGDAFFGWPEEAPFDAIIVTAAAPEVPPALFAQLAEGGRLVVPLGDPRTFQRLTVITKRAGEARVKRILEVSFVPMTGEILKKK
jgi:protein-L-isoaspartate(D-aspartate) O-methyltransferase